MERGEGVLAHGLDGHRKNLLVPVSLEQSFGVRAVVLAPASIRPYEVRWEQDDVVSQPSQPSRPRYLVAVKLQTMLGFRICPAQTHLGRQAQCGDVFTG